MKKYLARSTKYGSQRFGNCEICGKHATEIFYQQAFENGYVISESEAFGHLSCLLSSREKDAMDTKTLSELRGH